MGPVAMPESLFLAVAGEFVTGLFLGMLVRVAMAAIEVAGEAAGVQMGFGFQKSMNPLTKEQNGPITNLLFAMAGVLVFVSGVHLEVIRGLALSFHAVPIGAAGMVGNVETLVFLDGSLDIGVMGQVFGVLTLHLRVAVAEGREHDLASAREALGVPHHELFIIRRRRESQA